MKITVTKSILLIGLAFVVFGLIGCERSQPKMDADTWVEEKAFSESISRKARRIEKGMPRDEVIEILGPVYRSMTNVEGDYTCEEFRYINKVGYWFVLVWFEIDMVDMVVGATGSECALSVV